MSPPAWRKGDDRKDVRRKWLEEGAEAAKEARRRQEEAERKQAEKRKGK